MNTDELEARIQIVEKQRLNPHSNSIGTAFYIAGLQKEDKTLSSDDAKKVLQKKFDAVKNPSQEGEIVNLLEGDLVAVLNKDIIWMGIVANDGSILYRDIGDYKSHRMTYQTLIDYHAGPFQIGAYRPRESKEN